MRALVTGAAGFIGSHLTQRLAADGWDVVAIDSLTPYYDVAQKRSNIAAIRTDVDLDVHEVDLVTADLEALLDGIDVVFHLAGQPGIRASWSEFRSYETHNILATQLLLEASRSRQIERFVFASSSSVYGNAGSYPTMEDTLPKPYSPYGVTKLAAEHLCGVYAHNFGVHTVSLRYFTVFGPRQRPDMAMHRLVRAAQLGESFPLFGTGQQVRDFTFVGDVVEANVLAASANTPPGTVVNIAGGGAITLLEVISTIERLTNASIDLDRQANQAGDVQRTGGSTDLARSALGWTPHVSLEEGLAAQVAWHERLLAT
jgi:nucleoside-diphosphate-sugar epimerase